MNNWLLNKLACSSTIYTPDFDSFYMAIITLTTDFGVKDPYAAIIKGSIYAQLSDVTIIDISHSISPFNIHEGAYILKNAYRHFPKGSIHIIGIDDEQTPEQKHILGLLNGHYFIGADNGIFSLLAENDTFEKLVTLTLAEGANRILSTIEVFVNAACHIARGGTPEIIGRNLLQVKEVKGLSPNVNLREDMITGHVIYIDNYGNVVTNITKNWFELIRKGRNYEISARNYKFNKIHNSYSESINFNTPKDNRDEDGKKLALFNSAGFLELSIYKSNLQTVGGASTLLGLYYRDTVFINFSEN